MNRIVWTFWTKPGIHAPWLSPLAHLSGWILSANLARRHYDTLALYTDSEGWDFLKGLDLPFDEVYLAYDDFEFDNPWFAAAKMKTLTLQPEPFIHIDSDVFLWDRMPDQDKAVVTQSFDDAMTSHYNVPLLRGLLKDKFSGITLPEAVSRYLYEGNPQVALNTGIVFANDLDIIDKYVETSFSMMRGEEYQELWSYLKTHHHYPSGQFMILLEQYMLHAVVEFWSKSHGVLLEGDFSEIREQARQLGYTHLIKAKKNHRVMANLVDYVRIKYPRQYEYAASVT